MSVRCDDVFARLLRLLRSAGANFKCVGVWQAPFGPSTVFPFQPKPKPKGESVGKFCNPKPVYSAALGTNKSSFIPKSNVPTTIYGARNQP
jgi:hypothetical protein